MPRQSPYRIVLSAAEERTLIDRAARYTRPYFEVLRATMILLAAEGWSNTPTVVCLVSPTRLSRDRWQNGSASVSTKYLQWRSATPPSLCKTTSTDSATPPERQTN